MVDTEPEDVAPPPTLYDEEGGAASPSRRRLRWTLATLFVLAALAGGIYLGLRTLETKSYAVPDLTGKLESVARNAVAEHDWTVVVDTERNDDHPVGEIIRTDPPAGTELDEGATIVFVVSDGPTLTKLPDVTGKSVDEATAELTAAKLATDVAAQVFDEVQPEGTVMSWTVPAQPGLKAGMEVIQQTVVALTVSKGPKPRIVPQLIGLDPAAAQAAAEALQLKLERDVDRFSNDVPAGIVLDQSQPAGSEIPRGATMVIAVSKGPDLVDVPSLDGLTIDQIRDTLAAAGLQVGKVTGPTTGSIARVTANGKAIHLGDKLLRGTALDFEYVAPEPPPEPAA
jgi:serine/threonine-protein kinase